MTTYGLRFGVQDDGDRYVARDRGQSCEHAVWGNGLVEWQPHERGGTMKPFVGPDDIYAQLCEGGTELWKPRAEATNALV